MFLFDVFNFGMIGSIINYNVFHHFCVELSPKTIIFYFSKQNPSVLAMWSNCLPEPPELSPRPRIPSFLNDFCAEMSPRATLNLPEAPSASQSLPEPPRASQSLSESPRASQSLSESLPESLPEPPRVSLNLSEFPRVSQSLPESPRASQRVSQ